jgi:hypothetical protein
MNQKGKESLLKLYQTEGLYDTCRITGLKSYDIINILNQPLDAQLSNDLLFDMLKSGVLPKNITTLNFSLVMMVFGILIKNLTWAETHT